MRATIRDRRIATLRAEAVMERWERRYLVNGAELTAYAVRRYHRGMRRHARDVIAEQLDEMDESDDG